MLLPQCDSGQCNSLSFPLPSLWTPPLWPSGKESASRAADLGLILPFTVFFSRSSHTSYLKIGTPVASLPGAWRKEGGVEEGGGRVGGCLVGSFKVEPDQS